MGASVVSEGLTSATVPAIVRNLELPKLLNYESLMIYYNGLILSLNLKSERNIASYSGTHEGSRLRTQDLGPTVGPRSIYTTQSSKFQIQIIFFEFNLMGLLLMYIGLGLIDMLTKLLSP